MSLKSEAARRRHCDYLLSRMIWETIILTLLTILSGEIFEFLRSNFNWLRYQHALLITAFLTVICNLLVIYGLRSWKTFYVNFGKIQRGILLFHIDYFMGPSNFRPSRL